MTTRWKWVTISSDLDLTVTLDSDDPELIERVEFSAKSNGIKLRRLDDDEGWPMPSGVTPPQPIAPDYADSAE